MPPQPGYITPTLYTSAAVTDLRMQLQTALATSYTLERELGRGGMATVFLAQVYGVDLSLRQQLGILAVLMVTSKGAAGVTGSGFIVLASTLQAMKVVPVEGIALLLGVDRFMSEARAITNLIGNGVATLVISRSEGAFDETKRAAAVEARAAAAPAAVSVTL